MNTTPDLGTQERPITIRHASSAARLQEELVRFARRIPVPHLLLDLAQDARHEAETLAPLGVSNAVELVERQGKRIRSLEGQLVELASEVEGWAHERERLERALREAELARGDLARRLAQVREKFEALASAPLESAP